MKKMIGVFCFGAVLLGAINSANATAPQLMPVQGVLLDSVGSPIDGATGLTFNIYNTFVDVTPVWTEVYELTNAVDVQDGFFTVYLGELDPSGNPLVIDWDAPEQWLGITVTGDVEMPRIRLASVPFALEAQSCRQFGVLGEDDADDLSVLIDTGCPPDTAFRAFDGAGGLICDADDTGAGGGITVVNGTAPITANTVGGTVTVGVTTGTTAGTVALGDHTHAGTYIPMMTCTTGYVLKYDGDSWECETDVDTHTTYAAGTGLTLAGTTFSVNYGTTAATAAAGNHTHDHGVMTGLADDDHPQYFNLSQNETVTGIPSFNGGTSGSTAPFAVDSTTAVTNLNADLLDGLHSSSFATAAHNHDTAYAPISHTHDHGAMTGLADDDHPQYFNLSQNENVSGDISFGSEVYFNSITEFNSEAYFYERPGFAYSGAASPFLVNSSVVVTNLNADQLDGYHASSFVQNNQDSVFHANPFLATTTTDLTIAKGVYNTKFSPSATSGSKQFYFPVDVPENVLGVAQRLKSVEICYYVENSADYIDRVFIYRYARDGSTSYLMYGSPLGWNSTGWTCQTITAPTPVSIDGSLIIYVWGEWAGTGTTREIVLGNVSVTTGP